MKRCLLPFVAALLFVSSSIFAAVTADTLITINSLPANGYLLDKGWKFYPGDDPAFSRRDYDDKNWQPIDPSLRIPQLPMTARQGIYWIRIKLHIDPSLRRNAALGVVQSAALEIYLNGALVGRRGTIDAKHHTGRAYFDANDPVELPLTDAPEQVLAIRVALQSSLHYLNGYTLNPLAGLKFLNTPQLVAGNDQIYHLKYALIAGTSILLFLGILHIILFRYKAQNRGNLYFAIYTVCFAFYLFSAFITFEVACSYDVLAYIAVLGVIVYVTGNLFGIKALYTLYKLPPGRAYPVLIFISAACLVMMLFIDDVKLYTMWAAYVLVNGAQLWLTLKAVRHKTRGALFILFGFLVSVIGIISFVYEGFNNELPGVITICLGTLGPPLGISLFLGRQFALDSQLLRLKLQQVEELSAQNLAQQIEKQQLLASQNETLERQVEERTAALNHSLDNLKATQTQLIQSEKMASLGELTAGIAHEIQNPLNFVNNFSEVSVELLDELKEEAKAGHNEDVIAIARDLSQNLEKISHHGKRADAIVKGMLQHSQTSSGAKELTNINNLADECMRLAYQNLRAKDKSFTAGLVTHLDQTLPHVNVIPQDMVRVMLNLFNNAFYAVNQKAKTAGADYKPTVELTTFAPPSGGWGAKVKDNGIGIPDAIREKIMQPFFTTKPTGEGTGLGLSLTYDMVVKGHAGSINVESKEGAFTIFTITLPIT